MACGALVTTVAVSGCSLSWASMSPDLPGAPASPTHAASPADGSAEGEAGAATGASSDVASPAVVPVVGDLDTGSTTHVRPAGDGSLVVDYWTAQDPAAWTPSTEGVVELAAHLEGVDARRTTRVSRFTATATDASGVKSVVAEDRGEFVLTPPFSYGSALGVPASPEGADSIALSLQWDLLVETEPESEEFFRQTVIDTVTIALRDPASPGDDA